jgi:hypothetical protein
MSLTYSQFQLLSYSQQDQFVRIYGQLLAQRWHGNYSIELYDLGLFYCELWLEQECLHWPYYYALTTDACLDVYALQAQLVHY